MDNYRFHQLLEEYINGHLDKAEAKELLNLLDDPTMSQQLEQLVDKQLDEHLYDQDVELPIIRQRIQKGLESNRYSGPKAGLYPVHGKHFIHRFRWAAAAIFLLLAGGIGLLQLHNQSLKQSSSAHVVAKHYKGDADPGHDGALLKLSNGRIIMVDTAKNGLIAMDGKVAVYKQNGRIVYKGTSDAIVYNEIMTGKGRQWSATLPDGSVAWLNAMSSIRYPLHFTGTERLVTLTGEGKFKVVHNKKIPFRVVVGGQVVEDIGTEFNINAYTDEKDIKTTIAEGSVSIRFFAKAAMGAGQEVRLKAGQQAETNNTGLIKVTNDVDIQKAMAWSNGLFSFDGETIETVMRQLARWYDVEVAYEGKASDTHFGGEISRNQTLAQVLKGLESMKVHFRIEEDKRIVVMP